MADAIATTNGAAQPPKRYPDDPRNRAARGWQAAPAPIRAEIMRWFGTLSQYGFTPTSFLNLALAMEPNERISHVDASGGPGHVVLWLWRADRVNQRVIEQHEKSNGVMS